VAALLGELGAGLGAVLSGVGWKGVVLAAVGQALVVGLVARAHRLRGDGIARLARHVLVADVVAVVALVAIGEVAFQLNHGYRTERVTVIAAHALFAGIVPLAVWYAAVRAALNRRAVWPALALAGVTFVGLALPGLRVSWAQRPAAVTRVTIPCPDLPKELDGLRIALVSDLHVGREVSREQARLRLAPLSSVDADVVVFAGDLGSGRLEFLQDAARVLGEAAPRGERVAVLGNHDRWTDEELAVSELSGQGFTVLRNSALRVAIGGGELWIAGVNDLYSGAARPEEAFEAVPDDGFVILLSHSPDILDDPFAKRADLILAGHTHGGQAVPPMVGPLACSSRFGPRYAAGLHRVGENMLFVTRGVGEVVVPFRLGCEPEIAVLELRAGER
jgi:predicted MPP superfamily phosphohydrolase